ncbi:ABC transporter permease [Anaerosalibacter sp. Marseille-P3206]|uniref:ABC transporter permease n=1 Tax=Anaerosalibacter sp. Marseille-P3206 TaxID=1871005 RepID=UPI0009874A91|nr:ABC transporter permease [Anaerosalibacter sp. Marseille-P3206]
MKLKAFTKLTVKSMLMNFLPLVLTFSIFPMFLSCVIGYFQKDQFTPSVDMPIMSVHIVDEDDSIQSRNLKQFLNNDQIKSIIEIKEEEKDARYELIIPKGYENSLKLSTDSPIIINTKDKGYQSMGTMLGNIIDKYNEEISQSMYIRKSIDGKDIFPKEKEELFNIVNNEIYQVYNTNSIKNTIVTTKRSLSSYEHFSITFLSYMFIMVIMSMVAGEDSQKESGVYNRIMSTSITEVEYFKYNMITSYMFIVFLNCLYVFTYRIAGLSFQGSISILILIILTQSLLATALTGFVLEFFKKKIGLGILNALMIIQLVIGVGYLPLQKIGNGFLAKIATDYAPDVLIARAYRNYLIYNNLESIKTNLLLISLISVVILLICTLKVKLKWGEQ